ncbi:xanthine dehydrogenase accessory protein XdhC [Limimaricola hongkongensis]|uniref:XdhC protein (Assists in molybdopterin insertion into xanthine dehydrogenase) n=1 Tax=Limimaricola hongkongensis DSM 17492 TaxID=1122180 RepID=A0A017H894_9RHOB|nr:xanthine dehydrogenase accessory protein XdhC [Limimaricola hongkongensis]EYD70722.1 XdhC protein (assists in molybdopterin insertion into xanthine dehydrogenase) [Limimaricola hongkongensis DSM 17492]
MSLDLAALTAAVTAHGAVVRVLVAATAGSAPRDPGTAMLVWEDGQSGTIGGGALEHEAVTAARDMLAAGRATAQRRLPLGPALRQCCGGAVTLVWERFDEAALPGAVPRARPMGPAGDMPATVARRLREMRPGAAPALLDGWLVEAAPPEVRPLWVWGAGHVGRAIVSVMAPMPGRAITWIDLSPDCFPDAIPGNVTAIPAAAPEALMRRAPVEADHLILTRDHDLDLALCHAALHHGFASCGLIGSATKWARFRSRLSALGHSNALISRIACPIGDTSLGRDPQAIAVGVASALLKGGNEKMTRDRAV